MQQKTKNKLLLCLQEMQYIREILDLRCTDDQTSRMLGLYVAMRMDDFIHMIQPLPPTHPNHEYIEEGRREYKDKLQDARHKLGAHFQSVVSEAPDDAELRLYDFMERNRIFSEIDYIKVTDLIDEALIVYQIATHTEGAAPALNHLSETDKEKIREVCEAINRNGILRVYPDFLHLGRPNSIGAIVCDKGQQKAQQLNSIAMLISDVSSLYDVDYSNPALKRMFKRMLVCWIVNFYDNLVTRPVPQTAPQFDPGLDRLLNETFDDERTHSAQQRIATLISEMQSLKNNQAVLDSAREVRNKACAHLDGASDVCDIDTLIDQYDADTLREQYELWHSTFKEILKSHNTLIPLQPMPRGEVYDAWSEKTVEKDFYGNSIDEISNAAFTGSISVEEAMAAIKDRDSEKNPLAQEKIRKILFDANGKEYESFTAQLCKLMENGITYEELETYSRLLHDAARGNPEKNQELLFSLWDKTKVLDPNAHKFILWPLTVNAEYDKSARLRGLIEGLIGSPELWMRLFGGLMAFHAEIAKTTSPLIGKKTPRLTREFLEIADAIPRDAAQNLILWLVMTSHCKFDTFFWHPDLQICSEDISDRLKRSCEEYCTAVDLDQEFRQHLMGLCNSHRYIELLWCLIKISKQTNDHTADFLSVVENNLIIGSSQDQTEILYWILCHEELGWIRQAEKRLRNMVEDSPSDKALRLNYVKFLTRHPEYTAELDRQRKYIEDHFPLTEEDRKCMV